MSEAFASDDDNSRRYGYYPARPWRFLHADVAHFARLATRLSEETGGRDELRTFECLLLAFDDASDHADVTLEGVREALNRTSRRSSPPAADAGLHTRFRRLLSPLDLDASFDGGWHLAALERGADRLRASFGHPTEQPLVLELSPRSRGPSYAQSSHYDICHANSSLTARQEQALRIVCRMIRANDH